VESDTRIVIVGYGMGAHHAKLIKEIEGLELAGVCDVEEAKREKALAEHPGIKTYANYADVLSDGEVDLIVLVTPHNTHATMAIASMDAGKHTITDKAMCLTVDEARAMIAARDRNRVLLSVFHNRRWDSDFVTVRKIIDEGVLGRLYHIQSCVTYYANIAGWRTDRAAMGGWLFDWGAHTLDQLLLIEKSPVKTVYAFAHHRFDEPTSVEDYVNCTLTFESGLTATTVVGYLNRIPMPRWYIMGQHATLQADDFEKPARIQGSFHGLTGEMAVPLIKTHWKSFYENIADTLAGRAELEVKPEQLVPQIAIAQAAYRSIETQQVIHLA
jgi:scyllo-inositol 2-dehydrogenase (NADP+)